MPTLKKLSAARRAFSGKIDLAFLQPFDQLGWRKVDKLHIVGAAEHRIGNAFAHLHAGDLRHNIRQALEMLDVHRRPHVDAGGDQLLDILVALWMAAFRSVGMGKFIDDDDARTPFQGGVEIELLDHAALIVDRAARQHFKPARAGPQSRSGHASPPAQ